MSNILIKGMEMPKNCWECSLSDIDDDFGRCCLYSGIACLTIGRQDNCPLVEIPTPHGRLGDLDALQEQIKLAVQDAHMSALWKQGMIYAHGLVEASKTVIEAEGRGE